MNCEQARGRRGLVVTFRPLLPRRRSPDGGLEGEIVGRASVLQGDISKRQFGDSSQILIMAADTTLFCF